MTLDDVCGSYSGSVHRSETVQVQPDGRAVTFKFRKLWACDGCGMVTERSDLMRHLRANVKRLAAEQEEEPRGGDRDRAADQGQAR